LNISLCTNDDQKILQFKNFKLYKSYGETELNVYSRGFSVRRLFYFENITEFIKKLKIIDKTLSGTAILKQQYEQDFIEFTGEKKGHVIVEGEIFEQSEFSQKIHFSFQTDQTVLKPFITDLESCNPV
jgi:hypothetical protein